MKIAHIGDVHWRSLSRHEEYVKIFEQFFKELKEKKIEHVFIAGDIFHTKTSGLSPEYIDMINWWIRGLSSSVTKGVHIILGNHDGNLTNDSRQDAITPIIDALSIKNVHLYKKSGVYKFDVGFNWCHFGIFDRQGWDSVIPHKGDINIACYHGGVIGSTSDTGWGISHGLDVSFFNKFDFVFLGDIHKMQHLSKRKTKNGKRPWISYCGSAIQQSYGESTEHGYLIWEINSVDDYEVSFHVLPNPHPFVTVDWRGSVDETLEEIIKYPNESRFRIKSNVRIPNQDASDIKDRAIELKQAIEVLFKVDYLNNESEKLRKTTENELKLLKSNLRDSDTLIELMHDYYHDIEIDDSEWSKITKIVQKYVSSLKIDSSVIRGVKWSPKKLDFEYTYGYGLNNSIDFEKLNGIVGIFGPNRSGKSSIIGTFLWTLFNSSDRGKIKNYHIINARQNYCKSSLTFSCNCHDYVIERQSVKNETKRSPDSSVTELNFFSVDDKGNLSSKNGIQRIDTEKEIRSIVGSFEDFLLMSVATQDDMSKFMKQGSTNRARILSKFLDLDVISSMHNLVKDDVQKIKVLMSSVTVKEWSRLISDNSKIKSELKLELEEIELSIESKKNKLDNLKTKFILDSGDSYVSLDDVKKQEKNVDSLRDKIKKLEESIVDLDDNIKKIENKLSTISGLKDKYDINDMKKSLSECEIIKEKVNKLDYKIQEEISLRDRQTESIKLLKQVPCGDKFPTCKFIKNSYKDKLKIDSQNEKIEKLREQIDNYRKEFESFKHDELKNNITKLEKIFSSELGLNRESEWKRKEKEMIDSRLTFERSKFIKENELLESLKKINEKSSSNLLNVLSKEIDDVTRDINSLDKRRMQISIKIERIENENSILQKDKKFYESHKSLLRIYELIENSFSKKGIPNRIIAKSLPIINEEIEKVLQGIVNFTIEMEINEDGNDLEVYINYGDSRRIAELGSGMEKMISSIAIRVALCNISSLPKSDIFIIDEGFGTLDETNIEASNRLLTALKKYYKTVMIITHIDSVKDVTDSVIEISRNEKNSFVSH